ncbi:hypothetical protein V6N12_051554 [Hibiscus sabdariffa]|uniref:Uncharacterized protein n=1 Tax=Hibiscus sabdariffa TaxID=183260 RepID=A0ABR2GGP7_9ROSI
MRGRRNETLGKLGDCCDSSGVDESAKFGDPDGKYGEVCEVGELDVGEVCGLDELDDVGESAETLREPDEGQFEER